MSKNGLANPRVIDLVTFDDAKDTVTLVIVQEAPWPKGVALWNALAAKVNTYMSFARLGTMASQYPASVGKKLRVQVMAHVKVTDDVRVAVKKLGAELKKFDTGVEVVDVSKR